LTLSSICNKSTGPVGFNSTGPVLAMGTRNPQKIYKELRFNRRSTLWYHPHPLQRQGHLHLPAIQPALQVEKVKPGMSLTVLKTPMAQLHPL
jgi:hypothetical protein